jgi:hypothetical protein
VASAIADIETAAVANVINGDTGSSEVSVWVDEMFW